jgi:NADH dehydrogenase
VETVKRTLDLKRLIVPVSPELGYWMGRLLGLFMRDVVITREEIRGLMENRLCVDAPSLGTTRLSEWITTHRETLGRSYASELARRMDRFTAYENLSPCAR